MWKLIKYEFNYNWYHISMLVVLFIVYTMFSIFDLQLTTSPEFEIDYWGGIYSIVIYAFLFSTWGVRSKEKRIRYHSLLPISQKINAFSRFWIATFPFLAITIYLVVVQLITIDNWHAETGSLIGQVGVCLILFAGFLRGRDDWYSHWMFGKRTQAAFVAVLIIQIIVVFVFLEMKELNNGLVGLYGPEAFHYAKLIFPLLGFIILVTTVFSYRKRRSYLS